MRALELGAAQISNELEIEYEELGLRRDVSVIRSHACPTVQAGCDGKERGRLTQPPRTKRECMDHEECPTRVVHRAYAL